MINPRRTGAFISGLRKQQDWTQSQLAEKLNVTHQAVSRWESGVTFPDLTTLAAIARLFNVKVDDLLNGERASPDGTAPAGSPNQPSSEMIDRLAAGQAEEAARLIKEMPEQMESLIEFAPLAPPSLMKGVLTKMTDFPFDLKHIEALAPYLDSDTLLMLVEQISSGELNKAALGEIAPYLPGEHLDRFAEQVIAGTLSTDYLEELAPFLRRETLDRIVDHLGQGSLGYEVLEELAPYLSKQTLSRLVARYQEGTLAFEHIVQLAPSLSKETIDELIESRIASEGTSRAVEELFPYASKEKIGSLFSRVLEGSLDEEWLSDLAPYLDRRALNELVRQKLSKEEKVE